MKTHMTLEEKDKKVTTLKPTIENINAQHSDSIDSIQNKT